MEQFVHNIYLLNQEKKFSEDETYDLINLFLAVTVKAKNKINSLNSKLEYLKAMPDQADEVQRQLNLEIQKWSEKMRRLGGIPLSLYQVKVPADQGYYLWEFPSAEASFHLQD